MKNNSGNVDLVPEVSSVLTSKTGPLMFVFVCQGVGSHVCLPMWSWSCGPTPAVLQRLCFETLRLQGAMWQENGFGCAAAVSAFASHASALPVPLSLISAMAGPLELVYGCDLKL